MRKRLLSLLFLSLYGSMLFAQEPLDINDVERVPLGDFTYQWRNIYDRTPLHGKVPDYIKLQVLHHSPFQQGWHSRWII